MRSTVCCLLVIAVGLCTAIGTENKTLPVASLRLVDSDCGTVPATTTYERSLQKVLSRQKRWFVFPKGANIGITLSVLKAIIDGRPNGMRMIVEITTSYDIPPWLEGWKSINIWGVTPRAPPPETTPKPKLMHRADYHPVNYVWNYPRAPAYSNNRRKGQAVTSLIGNQPPVGRRKSFFHDRHFPAMHDHHREYRERRQIFQKLEALGERFGISGKACVLRAICEVNNNLLPEGMSFIQDVARIIFSLPVDQDIDDEYMDGARREPMNCAREFASSCPFNPVVYFLKNTQGSLEKWREWER